MTRFAENDQNADLEKCTQSDCQHMCVFLMCLFNEAELNWVNTYMRLMSELRQFEMGISTNLYFPAIGTAGLDRCSVNGYNLDPCPPPKIIPNTLLFTITI